MVTVDSNRMSGIGRSETPVRAALATSKRVPLADLPVLRSVSQRFATRLVVACLVLFAVFLLARLFWQLFSPLPYPDSAPTVVPVNQSVSDPADQIVARNPFAIAGAPVAVSLSNEVLKETTLDLTLHGVKINGDDSSAIIDVRNGIGQQSFQIGDDLADGVSLKEVRFDEVVISRGGAREVLRLKSAGNLEPRRSPRRTTSTRVVNQSIQQSERSVAATSRKLGRESKDDPARRFDIQEMVRFRVRPTEEGTPGIFLFPGSDPVAFAEAGLINQDRLVSINGKTLPQDLRQAYEYARQASQTDSLQLVVERDGVPKTISINIQDIIDRRESDDADITGDQVKL